MLVSVNCDQRLHCLSRPFWQTTSDQGLHCLSRPFWQTTSVLNFRMSGCRLLVVNRGYSNYWNEYAIYFTE